MKIFTAVVKKQPISYRDHQEHLHTSEVILSLIDKSVKNFFPVRDFDNEVFEISKGCNSQICWSMVSNESNRNTYNNKKNDFIDYIDVIGSCSVDINELYVGKFLDINKIRAMGGRFSLIKIDENSLEFVTDAVGSYIAFYAETEDYWIFSTHSTIVHYIQRSLAEPFKQFNPIYDVNSLRNFAIQGHYDHISCAFEGVKCIPLDSRLIIDFSGVQIHRFNSDIYESDSILSAIEYNDIVQNLAESITLACKPLVDAQSINFPISGGRDSRLVAAALFAVGLRQVKCATSGYPEHPDVIIGKRIADILGWPHETREPGPSPESLSYEDPVNRIIRALDVHDLQTSAWDDIEDYGPFISAPVLSGVGGELLRGGYMATKKVEVDTSQAIQQINNLLNGGSFFDIPPSILTQHYTRKILEVAQFNPMLALDYLYYDNRNYRWVTARRRGLTFRRVGVEPLFDNRVVSLSRKIDVKTKWQERLFFDVIAKLNPNLRDIPIEGSRWRFEAHHPIIVNNKNYADGWEKRTALSSTEKAKAYDFRSLFDLKLRTQIYSMILDSSRELEFLGVNRLKLENYLGNGPPKYPTAIWHLLTAIFIINGKWISPNRTKKELSFNMIVPKH